MNTADKPGQAPRTASALTETAREWLRDLVAPWVQDLELDVEQVDAQAALLRLPFNPRLCRQGGTICGQALASAADTAMIVAISAYLGAFRPMTTVSLTVNFMRPVSGSDVLIEARVIKPGKTITFGEILMRSVDGKVVAQATCTYAML